jgi:hypothetical protein
MWIVVVFWLLIALVGISVLLFYWLQSQPIEAAAGSVSSLAEINMSAVIFSRLSNRVAREAFEQPLREIRLPPGSRSFYHHAWTLIRLIRPD